MYQFLLGEKGFNLSSLFIGREKVKFIIIWGMEKG